MLFIKLKSFGTKGSIVIETLTLGVRSMPAKVFRVKFKIQLFLTYFLQNRDI